MAYVSLSSDNEGGPSVRQEEHWVCSINLTVDQFISLWFTFLKIQPKVNEISKLRRT